MSPKNQERIFPQAYSFELLRIAQGDHDSASFLLSGLDEYATIRRYEEGRLSLSLDELQDIAALSKRVLRWCADVVESSARSAD